MKIRVAILATGDELVEMGKPLSDGKIRNSNAFVLMALVQQCQKELGIDIKYSIIDSEIKVHATLQHEVKKTDGKRHFVRGISESRDGTIAVHSAGSQMSNALTSLTKAN